MASSRGWLIFTAATAVILSFVAAADAAQLTGTVVSAGSDPKPIAGALVVLRRIEKGDWVYSGPVKTDAQGHFAVDEGDPSANGAGPQYGLSAYAPGYGLASLFITPGSAIEIRLGPELRIHGRVLDPKGKPVAGATVQLFSERNPIGAAYKSLRVLPPFTKLFQVTSGTDGSWQLGGLARTTTDSDEDGPPVALSNATFTLSGPQLVESDLFIAIDNPKEVDFIARIGGSISGSIVDVEGKPQAGAMIAAQSGEPRVFTESGQSDNGYATANAAPDGTFQISGLPKGSYTVMINPGTVTSEGPRLVAPAVTGVMVAEGKKTALASPLVMTPGAIVTGVVLSKATGKPVPGVGFYTFGPQHPRSQVNRWSNGEQTDAEGRFALRLAAGDNEIHISSAAAGFAFFDPAISVSVREGESKTLPPIQLPAAAHFTLKVTDEAGKPVTRLPLVIHEPDSSGGYQLDNASRTDDHGVWDSDKQNWPALSAEETRPWQIMVSSDWEVVSPKEILVADSSPVAVVVRKVDLASRPRGRAVTPDGKPIGGANVYAYSYFKDGDSQRDYQNENVQTDADGRFLLTPLRPGVIVQIGISKYDYRRAPGSPFDSLLHQPTDGKQPDFGDIVLLPLTGSVSGSVVDAANKPVAHAWLWSQDGDQRCVARSDALGHFTIQHVPANGAITLHAAHGLLTTTYIATARENASVQLPAVPAIRDATIAGRNRRRGLALMSELAHNTAPGQNERNDGKGGDTLADMLASLGEIDLAVHVGSAAGGTLDAKVLSGILENGVKVDPLKASELFLAHHSEWTDSDMILNRNCEMAMAFSNRDPSFANDCYRTAAKLIGTAISADSPWQMMTIARTAYRLNAADADDWAEKLIQLATKMMGANSELAAGAVAGAVAEGDGVHAARLLPRVPADKRSEAAAQVLLGMADQQPLEAKKLLDGWVADGTIHLAIDVGNRGPLDQAMMHLVKSLSAHDPAGALAIAKKSSAEVTWDMLMWAGSGQSDPVVRVAAYRDALTSGSQSRGAQSEAECLYFARQTKDAALAGEMRDRLPESMLSDILSFTGDSGENAARVTVAIGTEMPDLCRLLLEMALQQARDMNPGGDNEARNLQKAIQAMALIDPDRALQIADGVRGKDGAPRSKMEIVRALLTPQGKWHDLPGDPMF